MSTRSAATFSSGETIDQTRLRYLRDNGISQETSNPSGLSEGMRWVRTDLDRGYLYNGSASVLMDHYSASGRPWAKLSHDPAVLSVVAASNIGNIPWSANDDPDSASTNANVWNGTQYVAYTAPSTGLYCISWFLEYTTQASTNDLQWWVTAYTSSGYKLIGDGQPKAGVAGQGSLIVPMSASDFVYLKIYHEDSVSRTLAGTSYLVVARLYA